MDYESSYDSQNKEFIGKKGERLVISDGSFMLSTKTSIYVLRLSLIAGVYCEKRRSYYEVRIFADVRDTISAAARSARCLITLKAEDAKRLIAVLQAEIAG